MKVGRIGCFHNKYMEGNLSIPLIYAYYWLHDIRSYGSFYTILLIKEF